MDNVLIIQISHEQRSHNSNQSWTNFLLFKSIMDNVLIIQINHGPYSYY